MPRVTTAFSRRRPSPRRLGKASLAVALFSLLRANAALGAGVVINAPFTANPGDFISIEGSGFGSAPSVSLQPLNGTPQTIAPTRAQDNVVVFQIPSNLPFNLYTVQVNGSNPVALNAPAAFHYNTAEIFSGKDYAIAGRNLWIRGLTPTVTFIDAATNQQLAATVSVPNDATILTFKAPPGILDGHVYNAIVSNGLASAPVQETVLGHGLSNGDYFQISRPWAFDYIHANGPGYQPGNPKSVQTDQHIFDVTQTLADFDNPAASHRAVGDGVTNDSLAIQNAMEVCTRHGGGIVYLPPGTFNLATTGLIIRPGCVVQGYSSARTKVIFGPTAQLPSSFHMTGFSIPNAPSLTGIADLTIQNVDQLSQYVVNLSGNGNQFFIQRVNWDLGTGRNIALSGDRVAVENSTFFLGPNNQDPDPQTKGGMGSAIFWDSLSNLYFINNTVTHWTGEIRINDIVNGVIDNNHFSRYANTIIATSAQTGWPYIGSPIQVGQPIQATHGRQLAIAFAKNVLITHNTFDVPNPPLYYNMDDGETILNEGRDREDRGLVASASGGSFTAGPKCPNGATTPPIGKLLTGCAWNFFSNSMVMIVSGKGTGQWRHITNMNNNTFTIDQPWLVIPSPDDHFVIDVPNFENAIIENNTLTNNPIGIGMYYGAFLNTTISYNSMTDNGGIYFDPYINNSSAVFSSFSHIEANGNVLKNTKGFVPVYMVLGTAMVTDNTVWGATMLGAEVRNNQLTGHPGTYPFPFQEGFANYVGYGNRNAFVNNGQSLMIGNVLQNNRCANCTPFDVLLSTGVLDTVVWGMQTPNSPGVATSLIKDYPIWNGAPTSIGTVVGP